MNYDPFINACVALLRSGDLEHEDVASRVYDTYHQAKALLPVEYSPNSIAGCIAQVENFSRRQIPSMVGYWLGALEGALRREGFIDMESRYRVEAIAHALVDPEFWLRDPARPRRHA